MRYCRVVTYNQIMVNVSTTILRNISCVLRNSTPDIMLDCGFIVYLANSTDWKSVLI